MVIEFEKERLEQLLSDFYKVTERTVSIWDADYNQLVFRPKEMAAFCQMIKSSPEGNRRCTLSDREICEECFRTKKPAMHHCHAGLIDVALPILYGETLLGFLMFGQIQPKDAGADPFGQVRRKCRDLKLDGALLKKTFGR